MPHVIMKTDDLVSRLERAQRELRELAPAPRVELDREAVLDMVTLSLKCIKTLSKVH